MKLYKLLAILFFIAGIFFLIYGIILNEVSVVFLFVVPFIIASGPFSIFGVFLIFISILFFIIDIFKKLNNENRVSYGKDQGENFEKRSIKSKGIILIGPIPIFLGTNWKLSLLTIIIAILALILLSKIIKF